MPSSKPSATGADAPELIWLRPERTGRGPKPAHSRASIAAAAVTIADTEGLDAASMRRVASALGAGTMSLYNYVPKKEHLLDLMLDAVVGEFEIPPDPSGDIRADLERTARQLLGIMRRHPWVPRLLVARPSLGPNALRCTEHYLAVMADSGLDGTAKMEGFSLLNGFVAQFAEWERSASAGGRWAAELGAYLYTAATSGEYPHLARTFTEAGAPVDSDTVFERSLHRVVTAMLTPPA